MRACALVVRFKCFSVAAKLQSRAREDEISGVSAEAMISMRQGGASRGIFQLHGFIGAFAGD